MAYKPPPVKQPFAPAQAIGTLNDIFERVGLPRLDIVGDLPLPQPKRAATRVPGRAPPQAAAPARPTRTPKRTNPIVKELKRVQGSDEWAQWVGKPAPRSGPSKPHTSDILRFVGLVGSVAQTKLTPWGNESHSLSTVNGTPSAHGSGRAADIPASGAELVRLGRAALIAAGMDPKQARKQKGGLYNIGGFQVIFATKIGGNHYDHVHVGLRG